MEKILVVEDNANLLDILRAALSKAGHQVDEASDGTQALQKIHRRNYQLVLTDLKLPGASGLEVLQAAKEADPMTPVIVMTAFGSVEDAVQAMKQGALDFILKPVDLNHLLVLLERALDQQRLLRENVLLREEFAEQIGFPKIIGECASLQTVTRELQRVAPTHSTVLLLGESGTGKELFARALHSLSLRRDSPFVAINCAAIPEGLVETELFGYEKGAFTGAANRKVGKFELARGGTLFLDEIGELSLAIQGKLLRVIEEQTFERVGGVQSVECDVRIVAATNKDLRYAVEAKQFREDLYFRLSIFPIQIPPLRQRTSDIPLLAEFFLRRFAAEFNKPGLQLSDEAIRKLVRYQWPGNVRELQNCIERAAIMGEGKVIREADLNLAFEAPRRSAEPEKRFEDLDLSGSLKDVLNRVVPVIEREKIRDALDQSGWNRTKAAELLDISYKTLLTKIKEYKLE